jgi:hypothetical protein
MASSKPGQRVVLQLDSRIALEAIILNRLERIPATRRQEWLRGLLVQGFRAECQALRSATGSAERSPTPEVPGTKVAESKQYISPPVSRPAVAAPVPLPVDTASKPFAALGKVIG